MARHPGKHYQSAKQQVEAREYQLEEAVPLLKKIKFAKFDETVEVHMRLGVDPKHADQMVRGTVVMPNGLGKSKKVLVIAGGDKQKEAEEAGADFVGGDDMVNKIQSEGWTGFDAVIATPDMMRSVGKISFDVEKLVENASSLISAVIKAKPAVAKGKYVKSATICSTMSPGVAIDTAPFSVKATA